MNTDILGIRELKWTGRGEFNSDDLYIYYCGQESLRRNGVVLIVHKRVQFAALGTVSKQQNDLCLFPRKIIEYHSNPIYVPTTNTKEAEVE